LIPRKIVATISDTFKGEIPTMLKFVTALGAAVLLLAISNAAFAQHAKKCVSNCVPPSAGRGPGSGSGAAHIETESERLNNLGFDATIQRDWVTAIKYFELALRDDPNNAMAQRNLNVARGWLQAQLGRAARARGQQQMALQHLQQACLMLPKDAGAPVCREYLDHLNATTAVAPARRATNDGAPTARPGTRFFGQDANPPNPGLTAAATGPRRTGPNAAAQAGSAKLSARTGATMDGARGSEPGAVIPGFTKTITSAWSGDELAKLESTQRGREIVNDLKKVHDGLKGTQATIAKLRATPNAASNPAYAKALIAQDQLLNEKTSLERKGRQIITRVVLEGSETKKPQTEDRKR
jgi:tetratricopeptide (TPR) repeat protein